MANPGYLSGLFRKIPGFRSPQSPANPMADRLQALIQQNQRLQVQNSSLKNQIESLPAQGQTQIDFRKQISSLQSSLSEVQSRLQGNLPDYQSTLLTTLLTQNEQTIKQLSARFQPSPASKANYEQLRKATGSQGRLSFAIAQSKLIQNLTSQEDYKIFQLVRQLLIASESTAVGIARQTNQYEQVLDILERRLTLNREIMSNQVAEQYFNLLIELEQLKQGVVGEDVTCQQALNQAIDINSQALAAVEIRPEIQNRERNIQGLLEVFQKQTEDLVKTYKEIQLQKTVIENEKRDTAFIIRESSQKVFQACEVLAEMSRQQIGVAFRESLELEQVLEDQKEVSSRVLTLSQTHPRPLQGKLAVELINFLAEKTLERIEFLIQKMNVKDKPTLQAQASLKKNSQNLFKTLKAFLQKPQPDDKFFQDTIQKSQIFFQQGIQLDSQILKQIPQISSTAFNSLREAANSSENFLRLLLARHKGNKNFHKQYQELANGRLKINQLLSEIQKSNGLQGRVQTVKGLVGLTADWVVQCENLKTSMLKSDPSGLVIDQESFAKLENTLASIEAPTQELRQKLQESEDKILVAADFLQTFSQSPVKSDQESLIQIDNLVTQLQNASVNMGSEAKTKEVEELVNKLNQVRDHPQRVSLSIESLSNFFNTVFTPERSLRRVRTTVSDRPLVLRYNSVPVQESPENTIWVPLLKSLEDLLIHSYQKLIISNPVLKNSIEPVIERNQALVSSIGSADHNKIHQLVTTQVKLMGEIVENAYNLNDITKNLGEFKNQQINLQKMSQEFLNKMKTAYDKQTVDRSLGRKRTYVNVIYAEPEQDNLPIQTILNLIDDIKTNQEMIITLQKCKQETFDRQEKAEELVVKMEEILKTDPKWEYLLAVEEPEPMGTIHRRFEYILDNLQLLSGSPVSQNLVKKVGEIALTLHQFGKTAVNSLGQQEFEELAEKVQKFSEISDSSEKLEQGIQLIQEQADLLKGSLRSIQRSRTMQPQRSLRLKYDLNSSPSANQIWVPLYKKLEKLLIFSYQKLVGFNPEIRDTIEPELKVNSEIQNQISKQNSETICTSITKQIKLFKLVVKNAYSLQDITKALQQIETKQVQLQKQLQSFLSSLIQAVNEPQTGRRLSKRDTYLNVIYAQPTYDNLPIQTILKLLSDLNDNQQVLFDIVERISDIFNRQERATSLVQKLNSALDKHDEFIQVVQMQNQNSLISLFQKVTEIANHFQQVQDQGEEQAQSEPDILDIEQAVDLLNNLTLSIQTFSRTSVPVQSRSDLDTLFTRYTNIQESPNSLQKIIFMVNLLQEHVNLFQKEVRGSRRSMTQMVSSSPLTLRVPQQSFLPPVQTNPILDAFENLLRVSYSKLEISDSSLQIDFQNHVQQIRNLKQPISQPKLNELYTTYLDLMQKVIDNSFTMSNVTKNLQEIADKQVELEKVSEKVANKLKNLLNLPGNRQNRRATTYVTVTYAEPQEDKQPIHTVLQLIDDILTTQNKLETFQNRKLLCLETQQFPRVVLQELLQSLKSASIEVETLQSDQPIVSLCRTVKNLPPDCFSKGEDLSRFTNLNQLIQLASNLYTALTNQTLEPPGTESTNQLLDYLGQLLNISSDYFLTNLKSKLDSSQSLTKTNKKLSEILGVCSQFTRSIDPDCEYLKKSDQLISSPQKDSQISSKLRNLKSQITFISQKLQASVDSLKADLAELELQKQVVSQENQELKEALEKGNNQGSLI